MYFEMMPKLLLNLEGKGTTYKMVTDITTRISSSQEIRNNVFLYDYYDVMDGDTPEIIAHKIYKDATLHWVILLCNDIIDPVYDWVMPYEELKRHVIAQYGEENIYKTHHYEDEDGNWVSFDHSNAARITNIQHAEQENEKKREIRVLQPRYVAAFVSEVEEKLKQQVA